MDRGEFGSAWPLVLASAVGFGLGLSGLPFYTAGVFLDPLVHTFGWSTAEVQSGLLVMLWSMAVLAPAAGWAADRFGARPVALISIALFSLTFMSLGLTSSSLLQWRLTWGVLALSGSGTLPVIWSRAVSGRFVRARGLALGLVMAGTGLTAILAPVAGAWLIAHVGWRMAYVWLGALPLLASLPVVALLFRNFSSQTTTGNALLLEMPGLEPAEALRSVRFWLIAMAVGAIAAVVAGLIPNLVHILVALGQPRKLAVLIVSLLGVFVIAGRALSGFLIDRFWAPAIAFAFLAAPGVGCLLLVFGPTSLANAAIAAMLIGLAAGAEFDLLAYLIAAYFGMRRYGTIYGAASAIFTLGAGISPVVVATIFDRSGSYLPVLLGGAVIFIVAAASLLMLGSYKRLGATDV